MIQRYIVHVVRQGPSNKRFGWEIWQQDDLRLVQRSSETFRTRVEAVLDAAWMAARLEFNLDVRSLRSATSGARNGPWQIQGRIPSCFH